MSAISSARSSSINARLGYTPWVALAEGQRRYAFLGDGQSLLITLWEQSTGSVDHRTPGLHHLALEVAGIAELDRLEQDLRARQVPIFYEGVVAHAEGADPAALYFSDPDGLRLEAYTRTGGQGRKVAAIDGPACGLLRTIPFK